MVNNLSLSLRLSPQTSKTSESTASLLLAERWTISEIRRQLYSVLTYSLLTGVLRKSCFKSIVLIVKKRQGRASVN